MLIYNFSDIVSRYSGSDYIDTAISTHLNHTAIISLRKMAWLAGGAIRRSILGEPLDSDFDYFIKPNYKLSDCTKLLQQHQAKFLYKNYFNETWQLQQYKIQLIQLKQNNSLSEILQQFDFSICQFGLHDDNQMWCGDYSLLDLGRRRLVVNKITYPIASMRRIIKYSKQGYYACKGCMHDIFQSVIDNPDLLGQEPQYID